MPLHFLITQNCFTRRSSPPAPILKTADVIPNTLSEMLFRDGITRPVVLLRSVLVFGVRVGKKNRPFRSCLFYPIFPFFDFKYLNYLKKFDSFFEFFCSVREPTELIAQEQL